MDTNVDYSDEDVGNIISFEHVNLQIPDQTTATVFYVMGLGLTRDPYISVGLENMWINVGEQQFHLPTRRTQVIAGEIGLVVPDLDSLRERLVSVESRLAGTQFKWSESENSLIVTCPWGNSFRCYGPGVKFGDMSLGIPYVEFLVEKGSASGIARFYKEVFGAPAVSELAEGICTARVDIGRNQWVTFRETGRTIRPYGGYHIAVYVSGFSGPYGYLKERGFILEEVRNHQFRFKDIVDPASGEVLFRLEHEVRSLRHSMYHRPLVNRDPAQSQRGYRRGRDGLVPAGV